MQLFRRIFGQSDEIPEESNDDAPEAAKPAVDEDKTEQELPKVIGETTEMDLGATADLSPIPPSVTLQMAEDGEDNGSTRRLPLQDVISAKNARMEFGQSTDVGMVRSNNQDAMMSFYYSGRSVEDKPDFGLFIVADGMGGHHDGEKASAIVAHSVTEHVIQAIFIPMLKSVDDVNNMPPITEALTKAIQNANNEVIAKVPDGGTTCTTVAVVGNLAYFAHVGDSRAYLVTKDGIEQITRDHSLVQRLVELDQLAPEDAKSHANNNVLYRAIGQSDMLEVDALTRRLPINSYLLLCSDGLWNQVEDADILKIIQENPQPQSACDKLVAMANMMGGKDNITAVLLKVPK